MRLEELGFIGNCQAGALVHSSGDVVWCCLPRVDSEPVLGGLLDPDGGSFQVCAAEGGSGAGGRRGPGRPDPTRVYDYGIGPGLAKRSIAARRRH